MVWGVGSDYARLDVVADVTARLTMPAKGIGLLPAAELADPAMAHSVPLRTVSDLGIVGLVIWVLGMGVAMLRRPRGDWSWWAIAVLVPAMGVDYYAMRVPLVWVLLAWRAERIIAASR
jgi:hypothetical protein